MNAVPQEKPSENRILIPHRTLYQGQEFERLERNGIELALQDCQKAKYDTQFMPALIDARIEAPREELEFQRLLDLDDNEKVFVRDYTALQKSPSGVINVSKAIKHPQTIPFLGGEARAEAYLLRHEQVYGKNIGVRHSDDLADQPVGRVLFLGDFGNNCLGGGLELRRAFGRGTSWGRRRRRAVGNISSKRFRYRTCF